MSKKELDTRQAAFLEHYLSPKSETFGNAYKSALAAGYSDEYAQVITTRARQLMSEVEIRRNRLLDKAERNLEEFIDLDPMVDAMGPFGPIINKKTKLPYKRYSTAMAGLKLNATTFVAETVGKKFYSKRVEMNFIDPSALELSDKEKKEIDDIFHENMKALPAPQEKQ